MNLAKYAFIFLYILYFRGNHCDTNHTPIQKDGSLSYLTDHINNQQDFFRKWTDSEENYFKFFKSVESWIMGNFSQPLINTKRPEINLDCKNQHYSGVLTGEKLNQPRIIVDFVPFGYEVDKLYVRLYESADFVDAFIIYESTRTQSGLHKPLYFQKLKKQKRFQQWESKIIYFSSHDNDIEELIKRTKSELFKKRKGERYNTQNLWSLEKSMRTKMIEKFIQLNQTVSSLKMKIMSNLNTALGIQNDADEIIKGDVSIQINIKSNFILLLSLLLEKNELLYN
jgi:hypothetical protein